MRIRNLMFILGVYSLAACQASDGTNENNNVTSDDSTKENPDKPNQKQVGTVQGLVSTVLTKNGRNQKCYGFFLDTETFLTSRTCLESLSNNDCSSEDQLAGLNILAGADDVYPVLDIKSTETFGIKNNLVEKGFDLALLKTSKEFTGDTIALPDINTNQEAFEDLFTSVPPQVILDPELSIYMLSFAADGVTQGDSLYLNLRLYHGRDSEEFTAGSVKYDFCADYEGRPIFMDRDGQKVLIGLGSRVMTPDFVQCSDNNGIIFTSMLHQGVQDWIKGEQS
ncbi:hypothetical protein [Pseudobacteriovorax antillogorgiicola]|uniref:Trypsin n=1 Tax=Pseudobacteriovorax antillogorgiicola TaxID=1513793 RepID=A0A1Y6CQN0_9BACT|nr:hypothetical protein [Pseudobacteriovorax antillogorgiicola]TCS45868.1 hypothetical protein EDD56_12631 [Pseudobacteriovorax antillogorgiicola]SMF71299.1 hypothetical protein SAMN06296036_12667 [Pseudobacteriovorax antillogorgiicola]